MSQAELAELKSLALLPFFKLWSKWGRTAYMLHMGCSLLHGSPGASLPEAQIKVWYPASGGFQWDGALSFPFIPLNVLYWLHRWELRVEWRSSSISTLLRQSCENREALCSHSLCGSCCPAVLLGHYQIKDQGQGTLEKATSVAKTWRAQFKAPLLRASETQTRKTPTLKLLMTHDGFETLHGLEEHYHLGMDSVSLEDKHTNITC